MELISETLKIENETKLLGVKIVTLVRFLEKVLHTVNVVSKYGAHPYYDLFDNCAYFLIKFKDYIHCGFFTDLTFQLIKKNA